MYEPSEHDEITGLLRHLEQQLDALRASAYGLTEERSHETPCRSTPSIAALVKHATYGLREGTQRFRGTVPALVMSLEGVPANDFFQPGTPAPGTIGAS